MAFRRKDSAATGSQVFRNREQSTGYVVIGVGFFVVMLFWMALAKDLSVSGRLFGLGVGFIGGAFCFWLARSAVYTDSRGVEIVNPFRTMIVSWDDVLCFSVGRFGLYPKIGIVELKNGVRRHMSALQGPNPLGRPRNRTAETLVASLNDLLTEARSSRI